MIQMQLSAGPTQRPADGRIRPLIEAAHYRQVAGAAWPPLFAIARAWSFSPETRAALLDAVAEVSWIDCKRSLPLRSTHSHLHMLVEGWALQSCTLADGGRHITRILLAGDLYGWHADDGLDPPYDLEACGGARIAVLRKQALSGQQLQEIVERVTHRELITLRDRLVSLGRRDARGRVAHLVVELHDRLQPLGLCENGLVACPLTQEHLADTLGLTSVHVNRTLQGLKREGLVLFRRPHLIIQNIAALRKVAGLQELGSGSDPRG